MARKSPLFHLYVSRLREFYRQPARVFWVYGFPTMVAICLGLAFRDRPPEPVQVDVFSDATTAPVRQALEDYNKSLTKGQSPLILRVGAKAESIRRLHTGKTPLVVEGVSPTSVVYHFDPTRPEALTARAAVDSVIQRNKGREDPVASSNVEVTEPGSRYIDFLIPGLIGVNTMGGGLWGIGFLLVNFRVAKLLKAFVATPMPRRDFLLALIGARLTFLIPDLSLLLMLGSFGFGMPIRGSLALIVLVSVIGAMAFAGIGLLIGSRVQTTESVSGLMNLVMLPMWLFSGVFFSSERFPAGAQWVIQALPLTQLLNALRAVILDGATFIQVAPAIGILTLWAVGTFALALRIFRWS